MSSLPLAREAPGAERVPSPTDTELDLREQLSSLRGLLALSLLMTERREESEILHLARTAMPALVDCEVVGIHLAGAGWHGDGPRGRAATDPLISRRLRRLPPAGGQVDVPGKAWVWGFPLPGLEEPLGHLVVATPVPPPPGKVRLLRSFAQQTGIAVSNARLHASHVVTNAALARTVALLERKDEIHDRFTRVALDLDGYAGIVDTLFELTGLPAVIEDDKGNVLARAGIDHVTSTRSLAGSTPSELARRALRADGPLPCGDRLVTVARPRLDLLGLVYLLGPPSRMGEQETMALEYAATVLSLELARLQSIAETELRLGVDLVTDLVEGAGEGVEARARALGVDLGLPHRVVVLQGRRAEPATELLDLVRQATAGIRGVLLVPRADTVVAVVATDRADLRRPLGTVTASLRTLVDARGLHVGVGSVCHGAPDYPRSRKEALISLRLAASEPSRNGFVVYDDLGVYQFLSEVTDPQSVQAFVRRWLGPLLDYDERRGSELVLTLARYLDSGGSYDATATSLGVGRSTVRYRIRRVGELSQHAISDPDTRFHLQLACRAWLTVHALLPDQDVR